MDGVDAVFAVHCDPSLDVGRVGLREGPITAAADRVTVHLSGRGGHTSRPHLTEDLTFALAKVVTEVPAVLSRRLDPRSGLALVWGEVRAGSARNVIPSSGLVGGHPAHARRRRLENAGPMLGEHRGGGGGAVCRDRPPRARARRPAGGQPRGRHRRAAPRGSSAPASSRSPRSSPSAARTSPGTSPPSRAPWPGWARGRPAAATYDLHQGDLVVDEGAVAAGAKLLAGAVVADVIKAALPPGQQSRIR